MHRFRASLTTVLKHQLLSGSLIMFLGTNIYNFGQLIYHFLAGRYLGKAGYGDLAAILSILGVLGIIHGALGLTIVKFVASNKNDDELADFVKYMYKWNLLLGFFAATIILLSAPFLASFLNISGSYQIYLLAPILFFFFVTSAGRNIFQGLLKFDKLVYSLFAEATGKVFFTLIFLAINLAVIGALLGFFAGLVLSFVITTISLRAYLVGKIKKKLELIALFKYSLATLIQGLSLTSMYTIDLVLVKHFFTSDVAGLYAALAMLGRIVFFGTSPIIHVMFPIIAKRYLNKESYLKILYISMIMVSLISVGIIFIYYLIPGLIVGLLYGKSFTEGSYLLWWFGVFMGILSIATLLIQFYLSIGKINAVYIFVLAAILQAVLIWIVHPTILVVIQLSIFSATLLVFSLLVYFFYLNYKNGFKKR